MRVFLFTGCRCLDGPLDDVGKRWQGKKQRLKVKGEYYNGSYGRRNELGRRGMAAGSA